MRGVSETTGFPSRAAGRPPAAALVGSSRLAFALSGWSAAPALFVRSAGGTVPVRATTVAPAHACLGHRLPPGPGRGRAGTTPGAVTVTTRASASRLGKGRAEPCPRATAPPASPLTCSLGSGGRRGPAPDSRSGLAAARSARASPSSSRAPPLSLPSRSSPAEHIPPEGPGHAAPGRAACGPPLAAGRGLPRAPRGSWAPGVPAPPGPARPLLSSARPAPGLGAGLRRADSGAGR